MNDLAFIAATAVIYTAMLWWGALKLPGEKWQIMATIPVRKNGAGWKGLNLTYYGLLSANALLASSVLLLIFMGSLGVGSAETLLFVGPLLSVCIPASRLVALWVEHKPATLTIGGAGFLGIILAPWLVWLIRSSLGDSVAAGMQVVPVTAALSVSYCLGEGLGRLACLSFGCCYGLPLSKSPQWARRLFGRHPLVFTGCNKKASYESGLEGEPVLPVQVMTSAVLGAAALAGAYCFLNGWYVAALWVGVGVSGLWRAYSEILRADFRGNNKFTAYQVMALAGVVYAVAVPFIFTAPLPLAPALPAGLSLLWEPGTLLALQGLWLLVFWYSGSSKVTSSTITFHLVRDKV